MFSLKVFFLLFLLILPLRAFSFTSSEGGFSIWMPAEPSLQEIIHKSFAGNVVEKTYTVKTESQEFSVSYSRLPTLAFATQSTKALFNRAKDGFIKDTHSQELSFEKIDSAGQQGRELTFQIVNKDRIIDAVGKARFYLVDRTIYVVMAIESNYDGQEKIIRQFLDSFKFLS